MFRNYLAMNWCFCQILLHPVLLQVLLSVAPTRAFMDIIKNYNCNFKNNYNQRIINCFASFQNSNSDGYDDVPSGERSNSGGAVFQDQQSEHYCNLDPLVVCGPSGV